MLWTFLFLLLDLFLETLSSHSFTFRKLGWDVCAFEGLDGFTYVGVVHGVDIFEEGDQGNELFVLHLSLPFFEDDGVFGLLLGVVGVGVDEDYFGEVPVQVGEVLYAISILLSWWDGEVYFNILSLFVKSSFSE